MIEKLNVKRLNSSKFLVSWDPPPVHGGFINYYELSIQLVDGSNNSMNQKHNTSGEF
jgi:Fibronectin type III domain